MKKKTLCTVLVMALVGLPLTGYAQDPLTPERQREFSLKALDNVERLGIYFEIIADKQSPREDVQEATTLAFQLFDSEDAIVEVSSLNRPNDLQQYKIKTYLRRLRALNYTNIVIEWADVAYVSNLRRAPNGYYYGVVTITLRFRGYIENRLIYSDITEKHIEVLVKPTSIGKDGKIVREWTVCLTGVFVKVTRELVR